MRTLSVVLLSALLFAGCTSLNQVPKSEAYKSLYQEQPLSVLVLPPINKSTKVEAKELFYSSLVVPVTLRGYYTMPPLLTMDILKEESAYDAELYANQSTKKFGEVFGVDAVLFTTIHSWDKTTIASKINVKIEYVLKSTKTDEVLFNRIGDITLSVSVNSGSLLADMVGSMLATALTKEIIVGRNCNFFTLNDIPAGKYDPLFGQDGQNPSGPKEFTQFLNNSY